MSHQQSQFEEYLQTFRAYFEGPGHSAIDDVLDRYDPAVVSDRYPEPVRIDWQQLRAFDSDLADNLQSHPSTIKQYAEEAVKTDYSVINKHDREVSLNTVLRVRNLPEEHTHPVDLLRGYHLDRLIAVDVKVVKVDPVNPMITEAAYECQRCGTVTYIPQRPYAKMQEPQDCMGCEQEGPFRIIERQSDFGDCQLVKAIAADPILDEPRALRIFLMDDLCGRLRKDDEVTLVGIYKLLPFDHPKQKRTNMETYLKVVSLDTDDTVEVGRMDAADLSDLILEYVTEHEEPQTTNDGEWYVARADVEDDITAQTDVSENDVQARIDGLIDENELIEQPGGRLAS